MTNEPKVVDGPMLEEQIKQALAQTREARFAVAFWGAGAGTKLGIRQGDDIEIVCKITSGGTNPYEIEELMRLGVKVKHHPKIHSKIGIVGERLSFVGSSNMSANGLSHEGVETKGWLETNVLFEGVHPEVCSRLDEICSAAMPISKSDLKDAKNHWRSRRGLTIEQSNEPDMSSLWQALVESSDTLRSMPITIAYYAEPTPDEWEIINKGQEAASHKYGKNVEVFWEWSDLPEGYIIAVVRSSETGHQLKDISYSFHPPLAHNFIQDDTEFLVVETRKHLPFFEKLRGSDLSEFKKLVAAYLKTKKKPRKSRAIAIQDLIEFQLNR